MSIPIPKLNLKDIKKRYLSGETAEQIAESYGVAAITIRRRLQGVRKKPTVFELDGAGLKKLRRMIQSYSLTDIAKAFGTNHNTIRAYCERKGIEIPTGPRKRVWLVCPHCEQETRYEIQLTPGR
ncbi:MAG: hypothetical protein K2X93_06810 [Candidatus Obscuribacterales bacterium]|nr:hypothetical protein [Candidatus Obscuribacterales bacterium]